MQSEECRHIAGLSAVDAHGYAFFRLAETIGTPEWRNGLSLAFPASDIAAVDGSVVTPGCIGLLGMSGTLPYYYTEAVAQAGGVAAGAFIDLLSAAAIDAFHSAWREGRPEYIPLPPIPVRRGPLRARALGETLSEALAVTVRIEQFAGRWDKLPPAQASALGRANTCCGSGALLGERLRRIDGAVIVHVGPLDRQAGRGFLPGGRYALELARLWRAMAGDGGIRAEARIHVRSGESAGARLGGDTRLGHDTLLSTQPAGERDDLCYLLC